MVRLILSIVFLVIIAVFILLNIDYKTSINLFGAKFEQVPIVLVVLITFVVGILYSFIYYVMSYFTKLSRTRLSVQSRLNKDKEKQLRQREKKLDTIVEGNVTEAPSRPGAARPRAGKSRTSRAAAFLPEGPQPEPAPSEASQSGTPHSDAAQSGAPQEGRKRGLFGRRKG